MPVYIVVVRVDYEGDRNHGVYLTLDEAIIHQEELQRNYDHDHFSDHTVVIQRWDVKS